MIDVSRPAATLQSFWKRLSPLPFGKTILSKLLGFVIPYAATISPQIKQLQPGLVKLSMKDRRRVRNHLNSVHAIAMANLAEACTGLAATISMPTDKRSILVGFQIQYLKKARGELTAVSRFELPPGFGEGEVPVEAQIENAAGEVVATAQAIWRVGPIR